MPGGAGVVTLLRAAQVRPSARPDALFATAAHLSGLLAGYGARHRRPRRPSPVRAAPAATVLTAAVDPAAPVAPDRVPARQSSTFAQLSGD